VWGVRFHDRAIKEGRYKSGGSKIHSNGAAKVVRASSTKRESLEELLEDLEEQANAVRRTIELLKRN
jgi:hypothetical protein